VGQLNGAGWVNTLPVVAQIQDKAYQNNDAAAQAQLGYMYLNGIDCDEDETLSHYWTKRGAENGNARAMARLGWEYEMGYKVDEDYDEAIKWYTLAAEKGNNMAMVNLGNIYTNGPYHIEKDWNKALELITAAAMNGHQGGLYELGQLYYYGELVEQDNEEACKWYIKSAIQGNKTALEQLRCMLENGEIDTESGSLFDIKLNISADRIVESVGIASGAVHSSINYADNVVLSAARGHGFAAEKANHLFDKITGKDAHLVGGDNAKNGADRLVNGINIQTKYCATGSKCISECFDDSGAFRYLNPDGTPMQIEVPSDDKIYNGAVDAMKDAIRKGKIQGVTDPEKASEIIKRGNFTHDQSRLIAKAGSVESLCFDAVNGVELAGYAGGISAAISFAIAIWSGEDFEVALESACYSGLKVGGIAWVSSIVSSQVGRTGVEQSLRGTTDWLTSQIGPKASHWIVEGLNTSSKSLNASSAINNMSKLLRGSAVTTAVTTVVLSSVDLYNIFNGRISGAQLFKNITTTVSGLAGGVGGWGVGGAAAGAAAGSIIPGAGTLVGAGMGALGSLLGSFAGGAVSQKVAKFVLDKFIEDDAIEMTDIIEGVFVEMSQLLLISKDEAEKIMDGLNSVDLSAELINMYESSDREFFACELLEPLFAEVIRNRTIISLPANDQMLEKVGMMIDTRLTITGTL
jgi:TPR repeat protein